MALQITGSGKPIFTDIDPTFTKNPKTGDLLTIRDDLAVRTSIRSLMSTAFGERLFQPTIGGSLRSLLFEPIDAITTMEIHDRILMTIRNHEPRVGQVVVDVTASPNENYYTVVVEYAIQAVGKQDRISVVLERVR
jgi:phage baseplate assembly protein W